MGAPALSVLVPAFDEAANLRAHLPVLRARARACTPDFEILVVDDGSADHTAEVVREFGRRDARVRLVRHPINLGPGAGIPTGLFWARGRWLMFLPADLAVEPEDIARLWAARRDADLVIGLRSDRRDYGPWRRLLSASYIALLKALSGSRVTQFNYVQLWRRPVLERLGVRSRGVFVTAEVILQAERAGLRLVQVPLRYRPRERGRARGASPAALLRCGLELVRFFAFGRRTGFDKS